MCIRSNVKESVESGVLGSTAGLGLIHKKGIAWDGYFINYQISELVWHVLESLLLTKC